MNTWLGKTHETPYVIRQKKEARRKKLSYKNSKNATHHKTRNIHKHTQKTNMVKGWVKPSPSRVALKRS